MDLVLALMVMGIVAVGAVVCIALVKFSSSGRHYGGGGHGGYGGGYGGGGCGSGGGDGGGGGGCGGGGGS